MTAKTQAETIERAFEDARMEDNRCSVGKLLDSVDHDVRVVIEGKIRDDLHYSAATISRVLKGLGFPPLASETINKHRKGSCRCQDVTR